MPRKKKTKAPTSLGDSNLSQAPQLLGDNTANQVYRTKYKGGEGFEGTGNHTGYLKENTVDTKAKYAVGASRLAQGLGFGNIIPETKWGTHNVTDRTGNTRTITGAVSKEAKGEALSSPIYDTDEHDSFMATIDPDLPPEFVADSAQTRGLKNVGGRWMGMSGNEINDIDLSRGNTQKGLNDLQWFDALIGNSDRHGGNIMVDPTTGDVSGIDNDLSFGSGSLAKMGNKIDENFVRGNDEKMLGLPSMIDKKTAKKLLGLNEKKLTKLLNPKGTPDDQKMDNRELKQAYDRLGVIKSHLKGMKKNGGFVKTWDQNTYQQQINEDVSGRKTGWNKNPIGGSYLQRQDKYLQRSRDTNNDLFWRKGHRNEDVAPPLPVAQPQPVLQPQAQAPQPSWTPSDNSKQGGQPRMQLPGSRGQQPKPPLQRTDSRTGGLTLAERKKRWLENAKG